MDEARRLESLLGQLRYVQSGPFLTGVVHDINNSIGAVIAYAELIGMGSHSREELDTMLDDLLTAAKRTAELNDALSTLTRREVLRRAPTAITPLIGQVAMVTEYRFRTNSVKLDVSVEGDPTLSVILYKNETARAIMYLLLNAFENVADAPRKEVALVAHVVTGELAVTVRDSGPAFGDGAFERALAPYYTTKPAPHLGLGLTAAKAIAELHGGTLEYDPGRGVTLRIRSEAG